MTERMRNKWWTPLCPAASTGAGTPAAVAQLFVFTGRAGVLERRLKSPVVFELTRQAKTLSVLSWMFMMG